MRPTDESRAVPPGRHADEGELHTFLDGSLDVLAPERAGVVRAHAEACPVCRDRLAVEAALRDRSLGLLASDDPLDAVVLPSLDELRQRADVDAGGGRRVGGTARWLLSWAATVAISLGVGWGIGVFGPEGLRPGVVPRPSPDRIPARVVGVVPESAAEPAEEQPTAGPAAEVAAEVATHEVPPPVRPPDASNAVATVEAPAPAPAPPPVDASLGDLGAIASPASSPPDEVADRPVSSALRRRFEELGVELPDSVAAAPPALWARSAAPRVVLSDRMPAVRQADAPVPASLDELRSVMAADNVSAGDAAPADVGLVLPGLVLDEVRWGEVWPGQDGVVAPQRLPDGRLVELRVAGRPVGGTVTADPPTERADEPAGWSRAVRAVEGGWLVLDGPLAPEALEVLLATAR